MSALWMIAPLVIIAGLALLAVLMHALRRETEALEASMMRLVRIGVNVDELRHEVTRSRRSRQ